MNINKSIQTRSVKLWRLLKGTIHQNKVNAFWLGGGNFGDDLTPLILEHFGKTPISCRFPASKKSFGNPNTPELVCVGSILHKVPNNFDGYILGSGSGSEDLKKTFSKAKILSVRGPLTEKCIAKSLNLPYGDPGILVSEILPISEPKHGKIGVVPHFQDINHKNIIDLIKKYPNDVIFINVKDSPNNVIKKIKQCDMIISSSLHGLITADAYGIPNIMMANRDNRPEKYDFKYKDYYYSMEEEFHFVKIDSKSNLLDFAKKASVSKNVSLLKENTIKSLLLFFELRKK